MTQEHDKPQFRTFVTTVASFAHRGLPQCSHCFETFPTWRNFQIHLERNCCQVQPIRPLASQSMRMATPEATPGQYPLLTEAHLTLLLSKPFGTAVLECIRHRRWRDLQSMPEATKDLTNHCILCGLFSNRPQDLNLHLRTQHRQLLPHVMSKASQLCKSQASNSPCSFCSRSFRRVHQCPVMTQAALILVNTDRTGTSYAQPGDDVLRCDVCGDTFQELQQVHEHLHTAHRLEPQDWDPLRDLLDNNPACAHCAAIFTEKSSVRHHITLGQCPSFDPLRMPSEHPIAQEWQELIQHGSIATLRQAPMKRLTLTLTCQFCQTSFKRTGDLSLHLQTVHSQLWKESQPHVQLLLEASRQLDAYVTP